MSELILKNKLDFFYCCDNIQDSIDKLVEELEKTYKYQIVCLVGASETVKDALLLNKKIQLQFAFFKDIKSINLDTYSCVVCFDALLANECKNFCTENNKNYIFFVQKYFDLSCFCKDSIHSKSLLLGVIINSEAIKKKLDTFAYKLFLDSSFALFILIENMINKLFFNENKYFNFEEKTKEICEIFEKNNKKTDFFLNFNEMIDIYFKLILLCNEVKNPISTNSSLDFMSNYFKRFVGFQVIFNCYKLFFIKMCPSLTRYKEMSGTMKNSQINFILNFNESKFWFKNEKFSSTCLEQINKVLKAQDDIKSICSKFCVDALYSDSKYNNFNKIREDLSILSTTNSEPSLLKVLNYLGCL